MTSSFVLPGTPEEKSVVWVHHLWSAQWTPAPTWWLCQRFSCPAPPSGACSSPCRNKQCFKVHVSLKKSSEERGSFCKHSHDVLHWFGFDEDSDGMKLSQLESLDGVSRNVQYTVFTLSDNTRHNHSCPDREAGGPSIQETQEHKFF